MMTAPDKAEQLLLSFPSRSAMGREDFLESACNRDAVTLVDSWPDWPEPVQLIVGPSGSGKTHLVEIWAAASGAYVARDRFLASEMLRAMDEGRPVAIEFSEAQSLDEGAIFHALNAARQTNSHLLLTAPQDLAQWDIVLPDLVSRLRAISPVVLGPPDEALLKQVIVKLFADRQTPIDISVLDYALVRLERSFEAANLFVQCCDDFALRSTRKISKQVAAEALQAVSDRMSGI